MRTIASPMPGNAAAATPTATVGRFWRQFIVYLLGVALVALLTIWQIGRDSGRTLQPNDMANGPVSQPMLLASGLLTSVAMALYLAGWLARRTRVTAAGRLSMWVALGLATCAWVVRWYESYQIGAGMGHIPVSNLYEVFVVFIILTGVMMLYVEDRYRSDGMTVFTLPLVGAAYAFLYWYGGTRGAGAITPLIPALQSYWMKLHVPANFLAYGAYSIAAMLAAARLLSGVRFLSARLPAVAWIDEAMYRAIAVGFACFTVATILGALWAAEAWGGYWSWDPKETWALVVWLNYAAWLHFRMLGKVRPVALAWWSLIGLFVTLFAFLGVNMYLAGLHSYGSL
ncbi:cytochrome c-type biogenesis protein CcsB [Cupriavidus sp. YR651]|uniref:c-type cytochrome biogenesis protein CcsB n=1 Tax=Cupriavidus sp. YR651 TaxID=1855315 RepID=UPI000882F4F0|nr:c-type cytochrome biogenesis protein CcsB [Cupriavidus sp. YR651]SDC54525.1 cytochrome c-type biogenesis protein CcsB [Cupriavidus sp. YR651]